MDTYDKIIVSVFEDCYKHVENFLDSKGLLQHTENTTKDFVANSNKINSLVNFEDLQPKLEKILDRYHLGHGNAPIRAYKKCCDLAKIHFYNRMAELA
jgi:hypothetical protein